jgi:hypothetical protein
MSMRFICNLQVERSPVLPVEERSLDIGRSAGSQSTVHGRSRLPVGLRDPHLRRQPRQPMGVQPSVVDRAARRPRTSARARRSPTPPGTRPRSCDTRSPQGRPRGRTRAPSPHRGRRTRPAARCWVLGVAVLVARPAGDEAPGAGATTLPTHGRSPPSAQRPTLCHLNSAALEWRILCDTAAKHSMSKAREPSPIRVPGNARECMYARLQAAASARWRGRP